MQITTQEVVDQLVNHNIKPSPYRIRILQYLYEAMSHPNVDAIYTALKDELPTLSKTTVYNTLNILVDAELVKQFNYKDNEAQYDLITKEHGHFICEQCGELYDFDFTIGECADKSLSEFMIKSKEVYFRGICKDCLLINK